MRARLYEVRRLREVRRVGQGTTEREPSGATPAQLGAGVRDGLECAGPVDSISSNHIGKDGYPATSAVEHVGVDQDHAHASAWPRSSWACGGRTLPAIDEGYAESRELLG